jgi:hypothetical protein
MSKYTFHEGTFIWPLNLGVKLTTHLNSNTRFLNLKRGIQTIKCKIKREKKKGTRFGPQWPFDPFTRLHPRGPNASPFFFFSLRALLIGGPIWAAAAAPTQFSLARASCYDVRWPHVPDSPLSSAGRCTHLARNLEPTWWPLHPGDKASWAPSRRTPTSANHPEGQHHLRLCGEPVTASSAP